MFVESTALVSRAADEMHIERPGGLGVSPMFRTVVDEC